MDTRKRSSVHAGDDRRTTSVNDPLNETNRSSDTPAGPKNKPSQLYWEVVGSVLGFVIGMLEV